MGVLEQTLEMLIQEQLLRQVGKDYGLAITDDLIAREIQRMDVFHDKDGKFDRDRFVRLLQANGMTERDLVDSLRIDLLRGNVQGAVAIGARAPDTLANLLYRYDAEKRSAETITLANAALPAPPTPDEPTLKEAHQEHAVRYTAPEYRTLSVAMLTADDLAKDITLTDEDIQAAYDARASEYVTPERRSLQQAVFPTREAAEKAASAVTGGKPLAEAAKESGGETSNLDNVAKADLSGPFEALAAQAFTLPVKGTSGAIESPLGWHVLTVTAVTPGGARPLAEVKDKLAEAVKRERATDRLFEAANKMDDALAGGASLADAAHEVGAHIVKLPPVDRSGKTDAGKEPEGVPGLATIVQTGYGVQSGATSNMTEIPDVGFFAVHVDQVTPSALKPFETVRDQVLSDWIAEKRAEAAAAKAKAAVDRLAAGVPAETVAKEIGGKAGKTPPLTRNPGKDSPLPPELLEDLFSLKPGQAAAAATADGQMIVRLAEIIPADPAAAGSELAQLKAAVRNGIANDLVTAYTAGLRQRYGVTVNQELLQSLRRESGT
jgi:peptidyl-prolyl cis-trans isomerase D